MVAHNPARFSSVPFPPDARGRVRWAGVACVWGGGLGALVSIALAFAAPAVEPGVYNYPLEESTFVVVQAASAVIYLVMAYGLMGLWWSRVVPPSIFGSSGALAAAGSLVLLAIVHLVSIAAAGFVDTAPFVDILNASFGVVTAASGLSLVLGGIAIMRGRAWAGRGAYVPLIMGIYVFAPLIPALLGPIILARIAVAGWCVLFVVLGVALLKLARSGRTGRAQPTRGVLTPG